MHRRSERRRRHRQAEIWGLAARCQGENGAALIPQLPAITVVTPCDALKSIAGVFKAAMSSWAWVSMKPGATMAPSASISLDALQSERFSDAVDATVVHCHIRRVHVPAGTVDDRASAHQQVNKGAAHATRPGPPGRQLPGMPGRLIRAMGARARAHARSGCDPHDEPRNPLR